MPSFIYHRTMPVDRLQSQQTKWRECEEALEEIRRMVQG
jgi:hypothetical protein